MEDLNHRLQVSLALKAARWLAGARNDNGTAAPLSIGQLAGAPVLAENAITRNRLEEIEQMKVDARPMELEKIGEALGFSLDALAALQRELVVRERERSQQIDAADQRTPRHSRKRPRT